MSENLTFSVGDRVRPTALWRDWKSPAIPSGVVRKVEPFGRGQVLYIGDDRLPYVSGIFELDEERND